MSCLNIANKTEYGLILTTHRVVPDSKHFAAKSWLLRPYFYLETWSACHWCHNHPNHNLLPEHLGDSDIDDMQPCSPYYQANGQYKTIRLMRQRLCHRKEHIIVICLLSTLSRIALVLCQHLQLPKKIYHQGIVLWQKST